MFPNIDLRIKVEKVVYEPLHEQTNILHMRKQRRRSASQLADQRLCFRYTVSIIRVLPNYKISSF